MAKITTSAKVLCGIVLFFFGRVVPLPASSVSTQLSALAHSMADRFNEYAAANKGATPESWDVLRPYLDFERTELKLGGPVQTKMILLSGDHPVLKGSSPAKIVAMTAFPINEDTRNGVGRYVIYQGSDKKFAARWESEQIIQQALAAAKRSVPPAAVYQERLLKPLDPEYGRKLVEDAVKQGVPVGKAANLVEKYLDEVSQRRVKLATTWAEVVAAMIRPKATPSPPSPSAAPATPAIPAPRH